MSHVVNRAMMLKSGPLYALISGLDSDRNASAEAIRQLYNHHGTATGMHLHTIFGRHFAEFCDILEELALNALPATFSPDMNYHQCVQQVNQVARVAHDPPAYLTNGSEANLFGVEPNFFCCTANMQQGWPRFAQSLFAVGEDGITVGPMRRHSWTPSGRVFGFLLSMRPAIRLKTRSESPYLRNAHLRLTEMPLCRVTDRDGN